MGNECELLDGARWNSFCLNAIAGTREEAEAEEVDKLLAKGEWASESQPHNLLVFHWTPGTVQNGITATTKKLKSVDYLICFQNALPVGIQNKYVTLASLCVCCASTFVRTRKRAKKKYQFDISWELVSLPMSTSVAFSSHIVIKQIKQKLIKFRKIYYCDEHNPRLRATRSAFVTRMKK